MSENSAAAGYLTCTHCGARSTRLLLAGPAESPKTVYVECTACGNLLVRIEPARWYDLAAGVSSLLGSSGLEAQDSGRQWLDQLTAHHQQVLEEFEQCRQEVHQLKPDPTEDQSVEGASSADTPSTLGLRDDGPSAGGP